MKQAFSYNHRDKIIHSTSLTLLALSAIILVGLQIKTAGWILLASGILIMLLSGNKQFKKDISLIFISLSLLGVARISTAIDGLRPISMAIPLLLALFIPYIVSRFVYKDYLIRFKFDHEKNWFKTEFTYVLVAVLLTYSLLPFILRMTGSYANWTIHNDIPYLIIAFICMNAVGIWDELFFVSTLLGILKRHTSFFSANLIQSVIFTSFLYELGFRGWSVLLIFIVTFLQGKAYQKTGSLFYLISIHLAVDFILFLALIHAYYPDLMPIFLIR